MYCTCAQHQAINCLIECPGLLGRGCRHCGVSQAADRPACGCKSVTDRLHVYHVLMLTSLRDRHLEIMDMQLA